MICLLHLPLPIQTPSFLCDMGRDEREGLDKGRSPSNCLFWLMSADAPCLSPVLATQKVS